MDSEKASENQIIGALRFQTLGGEEVVCAPGIAIYCWSSKGIEQASISYIASFGSPIIRPPMP